MQQNNLYYTEKLSAIKNETTHLWGAVFVTGGGAFAFLFSGVNFINIFWGIISIIVTVIIINAYVIRRNEIIRILNLIKEDE